VRHGSFGKFNFYPERTVVTPATDTATVARDRPPWSPSSFIPPHKPAISIDKSVALFVECDDAHSMRTGKLLDKVDLLYRAYGLCAAANEEIAQAISGETAKTIRESREEMLQYGWGHFRRGNAPAVRGYARRCGPPGAGGRRQVRRRVGAHP